MLGNVWNWDFFGACITLLDICIGMDILRITLLMLSVRKKSALLCD
jgi:hypothetical protein